MLLSIIIIIIIITKHLTLTPAGAELDLKRYGERRLARRKSPILTAETTRPLQKKWPLGELLASLHLTRTPDPALRYTMV